MAMGPLLYGPIAPVPRRLSMTTLYSTKAVAVGGRHGSVRTDDGLLDVQLALPTALGGNGGATNPEQLFAAGYAACFENAVIHVSRSRNARVGDKDVIVEATVGMQPNGAGGFVLTVAMAVDIGGLDQATAEQIVQAAHSACPYSNAIKGNIDVDITSRPTDGRGGESMTEDDVLRLDRQVCFPLYAASNLITRLYRPLLDALGLTYPQYLVMMVLWEKSPCTVGEVGEQLHLETGTLTPLLKRMEAAGLVARKRDASDERRVLVTLTEPGEALRAPAKSVPRALADKLAMPVTDLERLRTTLTGLLGAMTEKP